MLPQPSFGLFQLLADIAIGAKRFVERDMAEEIRDYVFMNYCESRKGVKIILFVCLSNLQFG